MGLYLGYLPTDNFVSYNREDKELDINLNVNPAIFVFKLNKIIYGYESWWSIIESENDFDEITDDDINNSWYIKMFKKLNNKEK